LERAVCWSVNSAVWRVTPIICVHCCCFESVAVSNVTVDRSLSLSLSLSLRFNGHSPGEPGLAGVY